MPVTTSKKSSKTKSVPEKATEQEPVQAPPVEQEVTPPSSDQDSVSSVVSVDKKIKELMASIDSQIKELKNVKQEVKDVLLHYTKEVKQNKNKKKRVKKDNSEYVPHGFTKPVHISKELAEFLGFKEDALVARPSVTSLVSKYVKDNGLADPKDGSIFKADEKLKKLLGEPRFLVKPKKPEYGYGYGYQSLQTYLAPHFRKN